MRPPVERGQWSAGWHRNSDIVRRQTSSSFSCLSWPNDRRYRAAEEGQGGACNQVEVDVKMTGCLATPAGSVCIIRFVEYLG